MGSTKEPGFASSGGMSARVKEFDWSRTSLGGFESWPDALKTTTDLILSSCLPQAIVWGADLVTIYNDAFALLLGDEPCSLGISFDEIFSESWETIGPICRAAFAGEATFVENFPAVAKRNAMREQAYFTFCYSPIRDGSGKVVGMLDTAVETTEAVHAVQHQQRLAFLYEISRALQAVNDANTIVAIATRMVGEHFQLSGCAYADMDYDEDRFTVRGDWTAAGAGGIVGRYRLADLGPLAVEKLRAGKPLIVEDFAHEPGSQQETAFQNIGIAAAFCMPLVREGRLTALMVLYDKAPRCWTDFEFSIIAETTERSWAHVERARAEEQLRRAQEASGVGLFAADLQSGLIRTSAEFCRIFGIAERDVLGFEDVAQLVVPEDAHILSVPERDLSFESLVEVEYRIRRADTGELRTLARKGGFERDSSGMPIRFVGAIRDVTDQREVQRALEQSEAQFRSLAEAIPNFVWIACTDGTIEWCNPWADRYAGPESTMRQRGNWLSFVHEEDQPAAAEVWPRVLQSGETYEVECRLRRSDGEYRWHLARATPARNPAGDIVRWIGVATDIHSQKLTGAEASRDRERLWAMSHDLLLICDRAGFISDVNPTATRLLGWSIEEMVGRPVLDFIHPADPKTTSAGGRGIGTPGGGGSLENRYRTKDGKYRLFEWTAAADGERFHAVGRDITDTRSMARDLERVWSLSPVLNVMASPDATILKVNPAWSAALGWHAEEVIGRPLLEFVAEADSDKAGALFERLTLGRPQGEEEITFMAKDGGTCQIAWSFVAESGYLFGFGRDITAQRIAEDALRQSQKMEAVGQLTGGIAHDFNNLLQGVTGNLELLQHRLEQGRLDGLERFIRSASTSANRASALTHRLLAFSRRQPLDPRPVNANPLISSMEDMLRRTLGEMVQLEFALADGLWLTKCDPNQLESAILNLVINARDAMPEGGKLIIETGNAHLDTAYASTHSDVRPGQYMCISVTDTGAGMAPEIISRAFEPFFTTKPIGQGTGLGLSMIYGFARQSEGHSKIYSEVGKGTTMKVYLPRFRGKAGDAEEPPGLSADHATEAGETVLVVEDEPVVRGLIVEILSELGYRAIEAVDGPSGLQILQSTRRIDLLITDIGLPGLNGRQVADAGRERRPELKVLFMTGYAENAALASGFLEPGMAMITKPFAMEALASRIRTMIEAD